MTMVWTRALRGLAAAVLVALLGNFPLQAVAADAEGEEKASSIGGRFLLYSHTGEIVADQHFQDKFMLVYFGYTFCPDICPTSLSIITSALELLGKDAEQIQPLFITVDPDRDTVHQMGAYLEHFHPSIIGLTGPMQMIDRVAKSYKVRYAKVPPPKDDPENYAVDHSAGTFLMAPGGRFLVKMAHGIPPEEMAQRIRDFLP